MSLIRAFKAFFNSFKKEQEEEGPQDPTHLRLLTLLQKEGRLIDFLKEDISSYSDAQVGAAVRSIHAKCGESIEEFVTLRPLFTEEEGAVVTISQGYDSSAITVVGKVKGAAPYQGVLRHRGWQAHKKSLPKQMGHGSNGVICPAEVEVYSNNLKN